MAGWDSYTQKSTPADADTLMIKDTSGGVNKRTPFSGVWNWILTKLTDAVISQLETTNKSIIPAINELNSKTSIFNASSPTDIDLNALISPSTYTTNGSAPSARGWKNYPTNSTGYVQIEKFGGIVKQTYTVHSGDMFVRCKLTEWSSWKHITMENV